MNNRKEKNQLGIEIANIVGVLDFHRELKLDAVGDLLNSSESVTEVRYNPEENHWLQTRFKLGEHSKYVSFYRSGSCSIVGCDSLEQLNQLVNIILEAMRPAVQKEPALEVKNLVCIGKLDYDLDLANLAIEIGLENVEYEPEQFPGLIYRDPKSSAVLLVFATGKIVITGEDTLEDAESSFWRFRDRLDNGVSSL